MRQTRQVSVGLVIGKSGPELGLDEYPFHLVFITANQVNAFPAIAAGFGLEPRKRAGGYPGGQQRTLQGLARRLGLEQDMAQRLGSDPLGLVGENRQDLSEQGSWRGHSKSVLGSQGSFRDWAHPCGRLGHRGQ